MDTSTSSTRRSSSSPPDAPTAKTTSTGSAAGTAAATAATIAAEDSLKAIYAHTEWQSVPITSMQLATRLGLAPSTITEKVKKLAADGLVRHAPYGAITLTDAGREAAIRTVRRHRLVETWLVDEFGYTWDEVHDEAEVLEHALSDRLLDAIDARLGRPTRDPHGDPIPAADGTVTRPDAVLLAELPRGHAARVVRISDRDADVLRTITAAGIGLDDRAVAGEHDDAVESAIWVARPSD